MFFIKNKNPLVSYFVSIGAGLNQIPLIDAAKKLGFNVIGVDANSCAPGFVLCDLKIQESVENHVSIYDKLSELLIHGEITGIMTKSYGVAMKTTSFLAEKFNIPFLPFDRSDDFINKKKMKAVFKEHNLNSPKQYNISALANITNKAKINFPIILKPVVGHAKKGVGIIKNLEELKKNISSNRKKGDYIFEDFIKGDEIIAIGFIQKKRYHLVEITDKKTTPFPHFVDITHISPSKYSYKQEEIRRTGQDIAEAFGIDTSPLIMEFIIDDNNGLFLIEAVPEFGGEFLSDVLVPAKTGYNLISEAVKAVTNRGFRAPVYKNSKGAVVVKYISGKKGILASFSPLPKKTRGIVYSRIFKEIGSKVREPETNLDRVGVIVARGRNIEESLRCADEAESKYNIRYKDE